MMMRKFYRFVYMDVRTGSATLAKISTSTLAAPARSSARAQPSTVAPEVRTSSISTSLQPDDRGFAVFRHPEGALDIGGAFGAGQPDLLRSRLDAFERGGGDGHAAFGRDGGGKHGRLVEAPRPKPAPVQRYRHKSVGLDQEFAAGLRDPASHHRHQVEPVAIFECMHQAARNLVETHGGAGAVISRRIGDRLHGQDARTGVIQERECRAARNRAA